MVTIIIEDKKEGKDDRFIRVLLKKLFSAATDFNIESANGYTNLEKISPLLKQNDDAGIKNIIIFDADSDLENGGVVNRKKYLEEVLKKIDVNYELFLLPNNQDNGNFETLYEKIINQKHKNIIKCFENYETCLGKYLDHEGKSKYNIPDQKTKMMAYIYAHKMSNKKFEELKNKLNWQFDNPEYWDLDNDCLDPLKQFLKTSIENVSS